MSTSSLNHSLVDAIDPRRIMTALNHLAKISDPDFPGLTRLAYSRADMEGKNYIAELMSESGLDVHVSPIGNTFGTLTGLQCDQEAVMTGSHTDTVINAGAFDGMVGVVCAIEALRVLRQVKDELLHPLVVVDWTLEEATRFGLCHLGSKVFVGEEISQPDLLLKDSQGTTIAQAIQQVKLLKGSAFPSENDVSSAAMAAVNQSRGRPDQLKAYIELHIEQAGELEERGFPLGIVNAAAGPTRWAVEIVGEQAHSGSTPMNRRKNALLAASLFVLTVEQLCQDESVHGTVGTVTKLSVEPNAMNTVPGKCSLFLDLRSTDAQSKNRVKAQLLKELENISARFKVEVTHSVITDEEPVMFSANIMSVIERSCRSLKVPFIAVPSRSGHDACTIAGQVKDVGMIFVPSKGGISHHPAEWTDPESILLGAKVLLLSLLDLATSA